MQPSSPSESEVKTEMSSELVILCGPVECVANLTGGVRKKKGRKINNERKNKNERKKETGSREIKMTAYSRSKIILPGATRRVFRFPRIPLSLLILRFVL
jgi:hypothetical protein